MTAGKHLTSSRRLIYSGLVITLQLNGMSLSITRGQMKSSQRLGVSLLSEAGMFRRMLSVPMSGCPPLSRLLSIRICLFPPLIGWWGGVGKVDLLSAHFDSKQSRDPVNLPCTCYYVCNLITFALWSQEEGGSHWIWIPMVALSHWVCFLSFFFLERTADVLAPCLGQIFRRLLHMGNFPACWGLADVTTIPKGQPFSSVVNYRQIF